MMMTMQMMMMMIYICHIEPFDSLFQGLLCTVLEVCCIAHDASDEQYQVCKQTQVLILVADLKLTSYLVRVTCDLLCAPVK